MELVYSVSRPPTLKRDWNRDEVPLCCLSPKNIIAFTTTMNMTAGDGDIRGGNASTTMETIYHIYVCDMDKPWQVFPVSSYTNNIVALRWDASGTQLLVATAHGACHVWAMKNWLINEWECVQASTIEGEEIVALSWLHDGKLISFNADRRESTMFTDKVTRAKYLPSLVQFGGRPVQGWVAITSTGLICVGLLKSTENISTHTESLTSHRSCIHHADIAHDASGDILVAISDGSLTAAIKCYRVSLKMEKDTCSISCRPMASFYAKCHNDVSLRDSVTSRVTHIQFLSSEAGDVLIVGAGDTNISHVELWTLTNKVTSLNRMYKTPGSSDSTYTIHSWAFKSSISHTSLPTSVAVPRFPIIDPANSLFQYVAISYRDGSVKLVNRSNFQPMTSTNLDTGISEPTGGEKRRRLLPYIVHMQQTLTGCGLVGVDQHSTLYVMKAANTRDPVTQVIPAYLVGMLEYCMMVGYDWWDVIAALRPGMVETIIGKLRDNFMKHPMSHQELFTGRHLCVRGTLYRASSSAHRAADCHAHLMLVAVSNTFRSTLRPKALSAQEMGPSEKLTNNCSKNFESEIDKVVVTLNPENKEYIVDPMTLQELQPLMQWVGDLALYILTTLPTTQTYSTYPGAGLLHDHSFLSLLRETLVIIRIWGLINPTCLPHFTSTSSNFDCLAQLFKLLTKVWVVRRESSSAEFDEGIIDECCLLKSQVIVPPLHQGVLGRLDYGSSVLAQQHPVSYTFGEVPSHCARPTVVALPDGQPMCSHKVDMVRQVSLGVSPPGDTRQCSRCGAYSVQKPPGKNSALRAWELRWSKACLCGGHWKLINQQKKTIADI